MAEEAGQLRLFFTDNTDCQPRPSSSPPTHAQPLGYPPTNLRLLQRAGPGRRGRPPCGRQGAPRRQRQQRRQLAGVQDHQDPILGPSHIHLDRAQSLLPVLSPYQLSLRLKQQQRPGCFTLAMQAGQSSAQPQCPLTSRQFTPAARAAWKARAVLGGAAEGSPPWPHTSGGEPSRLQVAGNKGS